MDDDYDLPFPEERVEDDDVTEPGWRKASTVMDDDVDSAAKIKLEQTNANMMMRCSVLLLQVSCLSVVS